MFRDALVSLIILVVSSGVGLAANSFRKQPIPWIREVLPPPAEVVVDRASAVDASTSAPAERPGIITLEPVLQHLVAGTAFFIDARETHEYTLGHLKGALSLPSSAIFQNSEAIMSAVPPDAKVIVYCGGGNCEASHNVSDSLRRDFGFTDVLIYEKGWEEVEASGLFGEYVIREAVN